MLPKGERILPEDFAENWLMFRVMEVNRKRDRIVGEGYEVNVNLQPLLTMFCCRHANKQLGNTHRITSGRICDVVKNHLPS